MEADLSRRPPRGGPRRRTRRGFGGGLVVAELGHRVVRQVPKFGDLSVVMGLDHLVFREGPTTRPCAGAIWERPSRTSSLESLSMVATFGNRPPICRGSGRTAGGPKGRRTRSRAHTRRLVSPTARSSWFGSHGPGPQGRNTPFFERYPIRPISVQSTTYRPDVGAFSRIWGLAVLIATRDNSGRITRSTVTSTVTLDRDGMPR